MKRLAALFFAMAALAYSSAASADAFTVTFDPLGGSYTMPAIGLASGDKVPEPQAPVKEDGDFIGWCTSTDLAVEWDFAADVISGDMTLYAKWRPLFPIIVERGSATSRRARAGQRITITAYEPRENEYFERWTASHEDVDIDSPRSRTTYFIMPEHGVRITANFTTSWLSASGCSIGSALAIAIVALAMKKKIKNKK